MSPAETDLCCCILVLPSLDGYSLTISCTTSLHKVFRVIVPAANFIFDPHIFVAIFCVGE